MNSEEGEGIKALKLIEELQSYRGEVPTFVLFSGISLRALISIRKTLIDLPHGKEVDVILESPGGSGDHAYKIIRTFREHFDVVNIIIPFWAKSAATILAFGGNRIVLNEFGELGPLDAQIKRSTEDGYDEGYASALNVQSSLEQIEERARLGVLQMFKTVSADSDIRISKKQMFEMLLTQSSHFYEPLLQKIDTMEIGIMARYLNIGGMYARRILKQYTNIDDDNLKELLDFLVYGSPDHGYVIDYNILHPYLDSVVKPQDEPFGVDYAKALDKLSLLLMTEDIAKVGFINNLLPKAEVKTNNDILKKQRETKKDESSTAKASSKTKRADIKSTTSKGTRKPRANTTQ